MQRISTVLEGSKVMAVRKAVCAEGADRVVITSIPYLLCGMDMMDLYSECEMRKMDMKVRLDVTTNAGRSDRIITAIQRIVHTGKIIFTSRQDGSAKAHGLYK